MKVNNFKRFKRGIITGLIILAVFMSIFWLSTLDSVSADSQSKCGDYCKKVEACMKSKPEGKKHECWKEIKNPSPDTCHCVTPQ